jgi:hypothetical protein
MKPADGHGALPSLSVRLRSTEYYGRAAAMNIYGAHQCSAIRSRGLCPETSRTSPAVTAPVETVDPLSELASKDTHQGWKNADGQVARKYAGYFFFVCRRPLRVPSWRRFAVCRKPSTLGIGSNQ